MSWRQPEESSPTFVHIHHSCAATARKSCGNVRTCGPCSITELVLEPHAVSTFALLLLASCKVPCCGSSAAFQRCKACVEIGDDFMNGFGAQLPYSSDLVQVDRACVRLVEWRAAEVMSCLQFHVSTSLRHPEPTLACPHASQIGDSFKVAPMLPLHPSICLDCSGTLAPDLAPAQI